MDVVLGEMKSGNSRAALRAAILMFLMVLVGATVALAIWGGTQSERGRVPLPTDPTAIAPGTVAPDTLPSGNPDDLGIENVVEVSP